MIVISIRKQHLETTTPLYVQRAFGPDAGPPSRALCRVGRCRGALLGLLLLGHSAGPWNPTSMHVCACMCKCLNNSVKNQPEQKVHTSGTNFLKFDKHHPGTGLMYSGVNNLPKQKELTLRGPISPNSIQIILDRVS